MRILVTGGAGFLGKYVVRELEDHVVMDNLDPLCGGTECARVHADVSSLEDVVSVCKTYNIDSIVHLAALGRNLTCQNFPEKAWDTNVTGTRNVLEAARVLRLRRVVCCSSNITLSDKPTVYRSTKKAVEYLIDMYASLGVSCMALRPSNLYGKGQSKTEYQPCAFAGLDKSYATYGRFKVTGDGTQSRDWTHAADAARAFHLALHSECSGEVVDVCTGVGESINRVAEILEVDVEYIGTRPGDAKELISDPEPAKRAIGFTSHIKLEEAIGDAFPEVMKVFGVQNETSS